MIVVKNSGFLNIGDLVRVVHAERGAYGANDKIGIYMGTHKNIIYPIEADIHGITDCIDGYVIKLDNDKYWNIGSGYVEVEILESAFELPLKTYTKEIKKESTMIVKDFEISKSGNGVTVHFTDGTYKKSYAVAPDKFDLETALYICLAKKFQNEYKCDDIEELAKFFSMTKKHIKEVERVCSEYKKEEESKKIIANRRAKKIRYKANKKAREKEEMIEIQKEAYLRAIREANK